MFELERTFKDHLIQPPSYRQGLFSLDRVVQSPLQPDLEHLQWWGSYNFIGQHVSVSLHSHLKKKFFHISKSSIAPCPLTTGAGNESLFIFFTNPLYELKGHNKVFPETSLLQAELEAWLQFAQNKAEGSLAWNSDALRAY